MADTVGPGAAYDVVSPAPRDSWSHLLGLSPDALAFQTPAWVDALEAVTRYRDASRLYTLANGRQLVLPLVATPWLGVTTFSTAASLPYGWGFGGVLAPDGVTPADLELVLGDIARLPFMRTSIRASPLLAGLWPPASHFPRLVRVPRRAHILPLDGGWEAIWSQRFTGEARTAVRKAERSALTIESGSDSRLVDAFYALYRISMERWSHLSPLPPRVARWRTQRREPAAKFHAVAERLDEACRIWLASKSGRPVAAVVVLTHGDHASYWRGAMNESVAGPTRANYLLHRASIQAACAAGCRFYHMGETGASASLAQFKTRFGAEPHDYFEYRLERLPLTPAASALRAAAHLPGEGFR